MVTKPSAWGQAFSTKDYDLFMEGDLGPTDVPQPLYGHGLTSPNQETADALVYYEIQKQRGRNVPVRRIHRPGYVTGTSYTMTFPVRAQWTPALAIALRGGACIKDFLMIPNCVQERQFNHWIVFRDSTLNPPVFAEDPISITEDDNMVSFTSELSVTEEERGYAVGAFVTYDLGGTARANSAAFFIDDCVDCDLSEGFALVAIGGDGTAAPVNVLTENRFATVTTASVGAAGDVGKDTYTSGDLVVASYYTGASFAAATAGKLFVSSDRLATSPINTGITAVIARIVGYGSTLFAVGKNSSGDAVLYYSLNSGNSWTQQVSTALPSGSALLDAAWDNDTQRLYIVGEDATLILGRFQGSALQLTDISNASTLSGLGTGDLNTVVAMGKNHVFFAGAAGKAYQSRDGGATWEPLTIAGTTAITAADGDTNRLVVGAGSTLYVRDPLVQNSFKALVPEDGLTIAGTITSIRMAPDNFNLFVVTTSSGEIIFVKDFRPE